MKEIEVPTPHCKSCAKRKARTNPYERVQNIAGWAGLLAIPVLLIAVVGAYIMLIMWGYETGQYGSVEVTKVVEEPNNSWIGLVTFLGAFGMAGVLMAFVFWGEDVGNRWREQARKWEKEKRIED